MKDIDNQKEYWDEVAEKKEFTHPLRIDLIEKYFNKEDEILDYGCGYGRIITQLLNLNFKNIKGFDTSLELIRRGKTFSNLPIYQINSPLELPINDNSIDKLILFAVLTCIPSNKGQEELIDLLYSKLKPGGILYLSDYYLQNNSIEMDRYECLNGNKENFGVFYLKEGVIFRHHTREWINKLLGRFSIIEEQEIEVLTMIINPDDLEFIKDYSALESYDLLTLLPRLSETADAKHLAFDIRKQRSVVRYILSFLDKFYRRLPFS